MEVSDQPKLMFHGVDIINIDFDVKKQYDNEQGIELNIEPKVFYPKDNKNMFKIFMEISVSCKGYFKLNITGIGNFEFDKTFDDQSLKKAFINTNAPAIMFPYVRSFITTLTSNIGDVTGVITLPTQFFHGDLPELTVGE